MQVIDKDEPVANRFDSEIDELCTTLIAQFEPLARDLRTVLMIMKMNKDIERMADHAVNIAESEFFLTSRSALRSLADIQKMARVTSTMLKDGIASFITEDARLAQEVCERNNIVDEIGDVVLEDLTGLMRGEHDGIKRSLHLMRIAHNLERIADLSTNICEEVIYIVEGKDIKHHQDSLSE